MGFPGREPIEPPVDGAIFADGLASLAGDDHGDVRSAVDVERPRFTRPGSVVLDPNSIVLEENARSDPLACLTHRSPLEPRESGAYQASQHVAREGQPTAFLAPMCGPAITSM
jgi:hypothetical protein